VRDGNGDGIVGVVSRQQLPALTGGTGASAADLTFLPALRLVRRRNVKSKAALEIVELRVSL